MTRPSTKIRKLTVGSGRRILAVSDIHGCSSYLKNALAKANFCEDDLLVIVGDMIVRGNDSLGTLRNVMELCKGGNVIPLIGNVDAYSLEQILEINEDNAAGYYDYICGFRSWSGTSFYDELAAECGLIIDSPEALLRSKETVVSHFAEEFEFLANLDTVLETENYVFVHGGLRDKDIDANAGRSVWELTKYDAFMTETHHKFDKYVVVGHWPVNLYSGIVHQMGPVFDHCKRIIAIDGGCGIKRECQLNVLIIPDIGCPINEVSHIGYDEFPTIRALEDQQGNDDSVHINWMTREITVLERGEEFSFAEHKSSGRKLCVPNSYIRNNSECHDFTDRVLSVEAGDVLSLIHETSRGCIVKKNDVVGWYSGKYEK